MQLIPPMPLGPIWKLIHLGVLIHNSRHACVDCTVLRKIGRMRQPVIAQGGVANTVSMTSAVVVVAEVSVVVVGSVAVTMTEAVVVVGTVTIMAEDGVMRHEHALLTLLRGY